MNILVVEDNLADALLLVDLLSGAHAADDLNVAVVRDGESALRYLHDVPRDQRPLMIVLDLNLPKISGQEVLETIKTAEALKHIPVLVLTSSNDARDVLESYRHHANVYIVKPRDLDEFDHVVEALKEFWIRSATIPGRRENDQVGAG